MSGSAAEMTFKSGLLNKVTVLFWIIHMVPIGNKITQMFGVLIAFTFRIVIWMFCIHFFPFDELSNSPDNQYGLIISLQSFAAYQV